jgi:hypothetical protein
MGGVSLRESLKEGLGQLLIRISEILPWRISRDLPYKCKIEQCPLPQEKARRLERVHWSMEDVPQHKHNKLQNLWGWRMLARQSV